MVKFYPDLGHIVKLQGSNPFDGKNACSAMPGCTTQIVQLYCLLGSIMMFGIPCLESNASFFPRISCAC